jgi:hypothetical protein
VTPDTPLTYTVATEEMGKSVANRRRLSFGNVWLVPLLAFVEAKPNLKPLVVAAIDNETGN